jgi:uncharacterized protein YigE (DUF2233 family)
LFRRSIFGLYLCAALVFVAVSGVSAEKESCVARIANSESDWQLVSKGMEVRKIRILLDDGKSAGMTAVRIDPELFDIRLRWQAEGRFPSGSARQIARLTKAAIVVNAGYFDEKGRPLGYFRSGKRLLNSRLLFRGRKRALHLGAVFYVMKDFGKVGIVTREDFDSRGVREAFQAGPYLVRDGRPNPGLDAYREFRRADRRTVLALEKGGRLIFMVSEEFGRGISWCELQNFLSRPSVDGGMEVVESMNLDGGSSSQLYVKGGAQTFYLSGRNVPALIIAIPR